MTTQLAVPNNDLIRGRLIEREKSLIAKAQVMVQAARGQNSYGGYTFQRSIGLAKQRLSALQVGLLPIAIGGAWVSLRKLLDEGQYIPPQIVAKAEEVKERFPDATQAVYGFQENATTQQRRRVDPVLTMYYGEQHYFLGFWVEIAVPDDFVPEFIGFTTPGLLPKRGRGRPRKLLT